MENRAPCKGCKDRYTACSDHCQKPEYLAWQEERKRVKEAEKRYVCPIWKHGEVDRNEY